MKSVLILLLLLFGSSWSCYIETSWKTNVVGQAHCLIITGGTSGSVWGSNPYSSDSNLGKAAVHSGYLTIGQTGPLWITERPGQSSYTGSSQNGITTSSYGSWSYSFEITGSCNSCCPNNCLVCTTYTTCQTCVATYGLSGGTCVPCGAGKYTDSSSICQICPGGCTSCTSSTSCQSCVATYGLSGGVCAPCGSGEYIDSSSICQICPGGCTSCTSSTSCQSCIATYGLSGGICIPCGVGKYTDSSSMCEACPEGCAKCEISPEIPTKILCQTCFPGFELSGDHCESASLAIVSTLETTRIASAAVSASAKLINSASALGFSFGISGRIFMNIKYMNITYSNRLEIALETWQSSYLSLGLDFELPQVLKDKIGTKSLPYVFEKRQIASSFLENSWPNTILLLSLFAVFLIFKLLGIPTFTRRITQPLRNAFENFMLSQIYDMLGDVLLYAVIEYQVFDFHPSLTWLSIFLCILFTAIILGCLVFHCKTLRKCRRLLDEIKQQPDQRERLQSQFDKDHAGSKVLFDDFKDTSAGKQAFLLFLTLRDLLMSMILTTLFHYPLIETILFLFLTGFILIFLLIQRPFKSSLAGFQQTFLELIALGVNICLIILAILDKNQNQAGNTRINICTYILYSNMVFNISSIAFLLLLIIIKIYCFCKTRFKEQAKDIPQTISGPIHMTQSNENILQTDQTIREFETFATNHQLSVADITNIKPGESSFIESTLLSNKISHSQVRNNFSNFIGTEEKDVLQFSRIQRTHQISRQRGRVFLKNEQIRAFANKERNNNQIFNLHSPKIKNPRESRARYHSSETHQALKRKLFLNEKEIRLFDRFANPNLNEASQESILSQNKAQNIEPPQNNPVPGNSPDRCLLPHNARRRFIEF